jgi:hypothetical protein
MAAKVSALSKILHANFALIWSGHRVLAEVVTEIAALAEDRLTVLIAASEVKLCTLSVLITYFNGLVPFSWYSIKILSENCVRS